MIKFQIETQKLFESYYYSLEIVRRYESVMPKREYTKAQNQLASKKKEIERAHEAQRLRMIDEFPANNSVQTTIRPLGENEIYDYGNFAYEGSLHFAQAQLCRQ